MPPSASSPPSDCRGVLIAGQAGGFNVYLFSFSSGDLTIGPRASPFLFLSVVVVGAVSLFT